MLISINLKFKMILYIYRDSKFEKCLSELRNAGGNASLIAKKADEIINKIISQGRNHPTGIGRLTKNGEFRIKNCQKFDLGNGYRLIRMRQGCYFILLYIGTHDDCSRWLERNKGLRYVISDEGTIISTMEIPSENRSSVAENKPIDEYEEELMKRIDDRVLRKIFCGWLK